MRKDRTAPGGNRQPVVIGNSRQPPRLLSRREQARFEARRLHNLLLFVEHARNPQERASATAAVRRALRHYLADLQGRAEEGER